MFEKRVVIEDDGDVRAMGVRFGLDEQGIEDALREHRRMVGAKDVT